MSSSDDPTTTRFLDAMRAAGIGALPLPSLGLLVTHIGEDYENYEFDVVPQSVRSAVASAAKAAGLRAHGARRFTDAESGMEVLLGRGAASLSSDPSEEIDRLRADAPEALLIATPTQALLHALGMEPSDEIQADLERMVARTPANLAKIAQHARDPARRDRWLAVAEDLQRIQEEHVQERRERRRRGLQ